MPPPPQLRDILEGPLEGVTRIVLRHERCREFRLLSLLELALWVVFVVVLLVCLIVGMVLALLLGGGGGGGGEGHDGAAPGLPKVRFYRHWQELVLRLQDARGDVLRELRHAPRTAAEGDALLAAVLSAAQRAGLVVVETFGGQVSETLEVWYGGQPLLAHPERRELEACEATLARAGYQSERSPQGARLRRAGRARPRWRAGLALAIELPLLPLLCWSRGFRAAVRETWLDVRGVPPEAWVLALHADRRLTAQLERGARVREPLDLDARDLLGVTYSPSLGFDRDVSRLPPSLRLVARDGVHPLPVMANDSVGRAVRDWLLITAAELWEGVPAATARPTRCPYCGSLYRLETEGACPSCGAASLV